MSQLTTNRLQVLGNSDCIQTPGDLMFGKKSGMTQRGQAWELQTCVESVLHQAGNHLKEEDNASYRPGQPHVITNSTCGHLTGQKRSCLLLFSPWNNVLIIQPVHGSVHGVPNIGASGSTSMP